MGHVLSIHSYRGGTGKSNLIANFAWLAARQGKRVAVLDTDLQSPGVHVVLGLGRERIHQTLTDYVFGRCELEDAAYDLTREHGLEGGGALYLLPSSMRVDAIVRVVSEGYEVSRLNEQFETLMRDLKLDLLLLDTHPGLNRETLLTTAVSDVLVVVIRPDSQDFHGTAVLMEVARQLRVPRILMLGNKVPEGVDRSELRGRIESAFAHDVLSLLPLTEEMTLLGSRGLFAERFPMHALTRDMEAAVRTLLDALPAKP